MVDHGGSGPLWVETKCNTKHAQEIMIYGIDMDLCFLGPC
jgi:hypothetical protein